ncbi:MAG: L-Ala-D/L-Glu epimerase [Syntrophorhabdus sp. PtaU1.Bin050]|nr:MAG: L-Ala-D/L-Glu epimerase [Syntrophorhabdus sp. PtaU1.Bin050]
MRIVSAHLYAVRIPFKTPFSHRLMSRSYSDSIIVKLTADNGESGFGEGAPRSYVTGETVSSCIDHIQRVLLPPLAEKHDFSEWNLDLGPVALLSKINAALPGMKHDSATAFNASRAAVEIALIDMLLKQSGKSLGSLIPPVTDSVTYSAVITAGSTDIARRIALKCRQYEIGAVKIKVGRGDDYGRIAAVRDVLGESTSLRVDANGAFDVKGALALISSIQPLNIDSIEQPVPRGNVGTLAQVKINSPIPVMADESLVTEEDAIELVEKEACDLFNLRISKNGGIFRTVRLAEMARNAGMGFQLGCQVGETAILSAAGRHVAAHLSDAKFIEGSYGTLLLEEDIADESLQFGHGGKAPLLGKCGLGIRIREDLLEKYAAEIVKVEMS